VATFPATRRLHHKTEFDAVYKRGRRYHDQYFLVLAWPNAATAPRLGLSISAKSVGNSVNRNRVKRIVRESFRAHQHALPAVDVIVNSKPPARSALNRALHVSLEKLWADIARQCAP